MDKGAGEDWLTISCYLSTCNIDPFNLCEIKFHVTASRAACLYAKISRALHENIVYQAGESGSSSSCGTKTLVSPAVNADKLLEAVPKRMCLFQKYRVWRRSALPIYPRVSQQIPWIMRARVSSVTTCECLHLY